MTFGQTKAALSRVLKITKLILFVTGIITQILYLAYLAYAIVNSIGSQFINFTLAIVCSTYLIFYAVTENIKATKRVRNVAALSFSLLFKPKGKRVSITIWKIF